MAIDKLGIYNNALSKVGEPKLQTLTDNRDAVETLDAVYGLDAIQYCLRIVKPRFATLTESSTGAATGGGISLAYTHDLTSLAQTFLVQHAFYSDAELDQPINRFIQDGDNILCDYETIYVRYVWEETTEANFTPEFAQLLATYLAREICYKFDPDRYESINNDLNGLIELTVELESQRDPLMRPATQGSSLSTALRNLYNNALLILGKDKLPSGNTDHPWRVKLDTAMDSGAVAAVMEDTSWKFGNQTVKIEYDPNVSLTWGHQYAHEKPSDLLRINGLFTDEYMRVPLRDYEDQGDYFICSHDTIYLRYVDSDWITQVSAWPAYFTNLVAAYLAKQVAPGVAPKLLDHTVDTYDDRKSTAMGNDAVQSPPRKISQGSWTQSRFNGRYDRDRP
jgi:hypothetical protein